MARHADAFHDDSFDAEDSFLDDAAMTPVSDPFLDASAVERRMLASPSRRRQKLRRIPPACARSARAWPKPIRRPNRTSPPRVRRPPPNPRLRTLRRPPRALWRRWRQWTGFMARWAAMRMTR